MLIEHNYYYHNLDQFILIFILSLTISLTGGQTDKTVKTSLEKNTPTPKPPPATLVPVPSLKATVTTEAAWIQGSLERHNYFRSLHMSQPLKLNNTLSEISQSYANYLLERAIESYEKVKRVEYFEHNQAVLREYRLGENLYYVQAYYKKVNSSLAVNLWYDEIKDYDFEFARVKATSRPGSMIGHLTQLLWNGTTQMGTAYAEKVLSTRQTLTFVVANYYPAGNVQLVGDFPLKLYLQNVLPPIKDAENEIEGIDNLRVIENKILYWDVPKTSLTTPRSWIEASIDKHNEYRRANHVPDILISDELCEVAQAWANTLLKFGISDFNKNFILIRGVAGNYAAITRAEFGENLLYFISDGLVDPSYPVKLWYEQKRFYDFDHRRTNKTISTTAKTDHFEQVVWKSTTHMGIAFASGSLENGQILTFVVANYYPGSNRKPFEERIENVPYEHNPTYTAIQQLLILLLRF